MANTLAQLKVEVSGDGIQRTSTDLRSLKNEVAQTGQAASKAAPQVGGDGGGGGFFGGILGGAAKIGLATSGIGMLTGAIGGLSGGLLEGNTAFETYETQFSVLLKGTDDLAKGQERAKQRIGELSKFAANTPFELPQVVQAGKILEAFGLQGEKSMSRFKLSTTDVLQVVGDAAAGSGADFSELANTFGKFASGATGEALSRLQELGIVTKEQLRQVGVEFDKSGALVTPVDEAFSKIVGVVQGKMGGMMDAQSKTLDGMMGNFQDWIGQATRTMAAPIFDKVKEGMQALLQFLGSPAVMATLTTLATFIATTIGGAFDLIGNIMAFVGPPLMEFAGFIQNNIGPVIGFLGGGLTTLLIPALISLGSTIMTVAIPAFLAFMAPVIAAAAPFILLGAVVASLVMAWQNNFMGIRDIVQPIIDNVIVTVTNLASNIIPMLTNAFNTVVGFVSPVVDMFQLFFASLQAGEDPLQAFGDLVSNLGSFIGTALGQAIDWIANTGLPLLMESLGTWAAALWGWVGPQIPVLLGALGDLLATVGSWIWNTGVPWLVDHLLQWGGAFIGWVAPQIPPLLQNLLNLLTTVGGWIVNTGVPTLVSTLLQWGGAFIGWVGPQIMPLLGKLGELLAQVGGWIIGTALPAIVGHLLEWGGAFIGWVGPKIPELIGKLGELLGKLADWIITTALPQINAKLLEWGTAFLVWIANTVLPALGGKLAEIWNNLSSWIGTTASNILGAVASIGRNLVQGIWNGVSGMWDSFMGWVHEQILKIPEAVRNLLGISSPSEVMQAMFSMVPAGMQQGIADAFPAFLQSFSEHLSSVPEEAQKTATSTSWRDVGAQIVQGMRDEVIKAFDRTNDDSIRSIYFAGLDGMFQHTNTWAAMLRYDILGPFFLWVHDHTQETAAGMDETWSGSMNNIVSSTHAMVDAVIGELSRLPTSIGPGTGTVTTGTGTTGGGGTGTSTGNGSYTGGGGSGTPGSPKVAGLTSAGGLSPDIATGGGGKGMYGAVAAASSGGTSYYIGSVPVSPPPEVGDWLADVAKHINASSRGIDFNRKK